VLVSRAVSGHDKNCIFCAIQRGDAPCELLFETASIIAFVDIAPVVRGHALVIPREHHDPITEVPRELLADVMEGAQVLTRAFFEVFQADGVNVTQANGALAGQTVLHTDFHVIPRYVADPHDWQNPQGSYSNAAEMHAVAEDLRHAIASVRGGSA